jgi:hypothetical protein
MIRLILKPGRSWQLRTYSCASADAASLLLNDRAAALAVSVIHITSARASPIRRAHGFTGTEIVLATRALVTTRTTNVQRRNNNKRGRGGACICAVIFEILIGFRIGSQDWFQKRTQRESPAVIWLGRALAGRLARYAGSNEDSVLVVATA